METFQIIRSISSPSWKGTPEKMFGKLCYVTFVAALASYLACALGQTPATICTEEVRNESCKLPTCRCSGQDIPGGLAGDQIPQMVFLTFDDAVNIDNFLFYEDVLFNRKNPNGDAVTATFFITHEYTNYSQVHELWRRGHEIALHSMSHSASTQYWAQLDEQGWRQEVVQQRDQMAYFARIQPATDIKGFRAPFLQLGGDTMYSVLKASNFEWECSRPTLSFRKPGMWPYTLDYESTQDCQINPCPKNSHPGFWTVPMIDMLGDNGQGCAMVDACNPVPNTLDATYDMLVRNFQDHYNGTRAPYGVFAHAAWLNGTGDPGDNSIWNRREGYIKFLDYLSTLPDVYIVSVSRALAWVKNPTSLANIEDFEPFKVTLKPSQCPETVNCRYAPEQTPFPSERWLRSCVACPSTYPWLGNPIGRA